MRENESECERVEVRVSRVKWGASELRESVINYFMLHFNLKFIIVCIFLLPVKAALHHGGFVYIYAGLGIMKELPITSFICTTGTNGENYNI